MVEKPLKNLYKINTQNAQTLISCRFERFGPCPKAKINFKKI